MTYKNKNNLIFELAFHDKKRRLKIVLLSLTLAVILVSVLLLVGSMIRRSNTARADAPTIQSISPVVGPYYGGQQVTITGTHFAGSTITQISQIHGTTFVLLDDGTVWSWGDNANGKLGDGSNVVGSLTPVQVKGVNGVGYLNNVKQLSEGVHHMLALLNDGTVVAWGYNATGQLGDGTTTTGNTPVQVKGVGGSGTLSGVKQISSGGSAANGTSVALLEGGNLVTWGANPGGQLGNNTTTNSSAPVQVKGTGGVGLLSNVKQVSANQANIVAVLNDGTVYAWGDNRYGEVGDNTLTNRLVPVQVRGVGGTGNLTNIAQVSLGAWHIVALTNDGQVVAWGRSKEGELGNNSATGPSSCYNSDPCSMVPVQVKDASGSGVLTGVSKVAAGYYFSNALMDDGTVYAWGQNDQGQIGDGATTNRLLPVYVKNSAGTGNLTDVSDITRGVYSQAAFMKNGTVMAWGQNTFGELGEGVTSGKELLPIQAQFTGVGVSASIGGASCDNLQAISETEITCTAPAHSAGKTDVVVTNGDGSQSTLTQGYEYQSMSVDSISPDAGPSAGNTDVTIAGKWFKDRDLTIKQISSGQGYVCAIASDDLAYCWGGNGNQRGDGTTGTTQQNTPVAVKVGTNGSAIPAGTTFKKIASGYNQTCALASNDKLYCWGENGRGQLGNNSTVNSAVPVAVNTVGQNGSALPAGAVKDIASGGYFVCVIASDDRVYCWGYNTEGQLGDATTTQRNVPVAVKVTGQNGSVLPTATRQISAGAWHMCAIANDAQTYCWGRNANGQLGDNTVTTRTVPIKVNVSGTNASVLPTGPIINLSSGWFHTCVVGSDGRPYCWGQNTNGQLGDATTTQRNVPVAVKVTGQNGSALPAASISNQIATGQYASCVVTNSASIYCWGDNAYGNLGNNTTANSLVPVATSMYGQNGSALPQGQIKQISGGNGSFVCVIGSDSQVYCWGRNATGQLGNNQSTGSSPDYNSLVPTPVLRTQWQTSVSTTVGGNTCTNFILVSDGKATCAVMPHAAGKVDVVVTNGDGVNATLVQGYEYQGFSVSSITPEQGPVAGGTKVTIKGSGFVNQPVKFTQIDTGQEFACGLSDAGKVYCWGEVNSDFSTGPAIGTGSSTGSVVMVPIKADQPGDALYGKTVRQISVGYNHACAVTTENRLYCWGSDNIGQLGDGDAGGFSLVPKEVTGSGAMVGLTVKKVSAGVQLTCAIADNNKTYCWGWNRSGGVGDGTTTDRSLPVAVRANSGDVLYGKEIVDVSVSWDGACVIDSSGKAYCWGLNVYGQLGNNTTTDSYVPVAVRANSGDALFGKTIKSVSLGRYTVCVIANDNKLYCWGYNANGQIGNNLTTNTSVPVAVRANSGDVLFNKTMTSIDGGYQFTCALDSANLLYCWGDNTDGQLGVGNTTNTLLPKLGASSGKINGESVIAVSASDKIAGAAGRYACAITSSGKPYCWGRGDYGRLGNGTTNNSTTPVALIPRAGTVPPTVTLDGQTCTNVKLVDANTLTCNVPSHAAGKVDVVMTNGDGQTGTLSQGYEYVLPPPPSITSITPNRGPSDTGWPSPTPNTRVTIRGTNFYGNPSWQPLATASKLWSSVASSASGTSVVATVTNGYIYTSTDGGVTWTEQTDAGTGPWRSVASSADGMTLVAVGNTIYTSTDGGVTWTEQVSAGSRAWTSVAMSDDGTRLVATAYNGYIYTSTDGGATWTERSAAGQKMWWSVASSADGTKLTAAAQDGIYVSTDSGVTWQARTPSGATQSWSSVASSADGTKLVAAGPGGYIYVSDDAGLNWQKVSSIAVDGSDGVYGGLAQQNWQSITMSDDGSKIIAVANDGTYVTSDDGGSSWYTRPPTTGRQWTAVTTSADGLVSYATIANDKVYKYEWPPTVYVDDRLCDGITVISSTELSCMVHYHAPGPVDVRVVNADGQSATLTDGYTYYDVPSAPQNFTATPADGTSGITLSWDPPLTDNYSTVTSYCYQYRIAAESNNGTAGEWSLCMPTNSSDTASRTTTITAPTIDAGKAYEFRIAATNEAGTGPYTDAPYPKAQVAFITLTVDDTVAMNVAPTSSEKMSSQSMMTNVKTNNASGYRLQFSVASSGTSLIHTTDSSKTITAVNGTPSVPVQLTGSGQGRWGWRADGIASFGGDPISNPTTIETNTDASSYTWSEVPLSSAPFILQSAAASNAISSSDAGTNMKIWFATSATPDQLSGTYKTKILYTAVASD